MTTEPDWADGRPLHQVAEIPGVVAIAIIDRAGATIVWSMMVEPDVVVDGSVDDLLSIVSASDRLDAWTEVILIGRDRCHLIRPFGVAERDNLVLELVLDMRTVNLAGARQQLQQLLEPYGSAPGQSADPADPPTSGGLARRVPAKPRSGGEATPGPDVGVLNQVLAGLRRPEER